MKMEKIDKTKNKPNTHSKTTKAMPRAYKIDSRKDPFERRGSVSRSPPAHTGAPTHLVSLEGDDAVGNNPKIDIRSSRDRVEESKDEAGSRDTTLGNIRKERSELEEFLFNESNKVNKSVVKFILAKWMLLEGKLQEAIMESEKLRAAHRDSRGTARTYAQVAVSAPWCYVPIKFLLLL